VGRSSNRTRSRSNRRARWRAPSIYFAAGAAVGIAALLSMIPSWVAWPLTSRGATALYIVATSIQLAVAEIAGGSG
jgi:hypothetical protein